MTNELDRAIADKVMGYEYLDYPAMPRYQKPDGNSAGLFDWHPSSNIEQAMQVVDRMIELGWWVNMNGLCNDGSWGVEFSRDTGEDPLNPNFYNAYNEKLSLAICEASLKAINEM